MAERWDYRNHDDVRDRDYNREHDRRGPLERAGDEVRSWFGDHEAARRRRLDETRDDRDRGWHDRERSWLKVSRPDQVIGTARIGASWTLGLPNTPPRPEL